MSWASSGARNVIPGFSRGNRRNVRSFRELSDVCYMQVRFVAPRPEDAPGRTIREPFIGAAIAFFAGMVGNRVVVDGDELCGVCDGKEIRARLRSGGAPVRHSALVAWGERMKRSRAVKNVQARDRRKRLDAAARRIEREAEAVRPTLDLGDGPL